MKWKRVATEFLPEKTFLIIKDDLESLEAKENSIRRVKPKSALDTGTWPPKLKNNNNHHHQNNHFRSSVIGERPKTANLERPSVLDPRLLNKLDMSLVSKEFLCDSMTRIHQSVKSRASGGARNTTSDSMSSKRRQSVPVPEKSCSFASCIPRKQISIPIDDTEHAKCPVSLPIVITLSAKKSPSHDNSSINETTSKIIAIDTCSIMKKQSIARRRNIFSGDNHENSSKKSQSIEAKRLDDNNNKNNDNSLRNNDNNATATKIIALSSVRKNKSSKIGVATEIEVFTGSATTKAAPEPCKTCGRPDQPERFHSHPRGSIVIMKKDKDPSSNGKRKISIPKTIQKPVALNFRSEKSRKNEAPDADKTRVSSSNGEKSVNSSPRDEIEEKNRKIVASAARKGPRTVTCYICSREFGTASFPIHEPKCMQKWERENNSLPASQRRAVPQRPVVPVDHRDWNTAAWEQSQAQLIPCWKCGRTFLPERLEIHQRSCKSIRKIGSSVNSPKTDERREKNNERSNTCTVNVVAPATILCQICGRNFGTRGMKIHEPQCVKKFQAENESLPSDRRKKIPARIERSIDTASQESPSTIGPTRLLPAATKPTTTCYICGRDFGSASIEIHEPQCLKKWQNENSMLPSDRQRKEPEKPEIIYTMDVTPTGSPIVDWTATTEARWKSHLGQLVPCKNCKRTFNPDRVAIHERSCKGIR